MSTSLHQNRIQRNRQVWFRKPLLRKVYSEFYQLMADHLSNLSDKRIVELGSGIGNIHETIPECLCTDLFKYPWIDQVENGYSLTFEDESLTDLLLMDVFHHLQYPGSVLQEFERVLRSGGRVIMIEPYISILGYLVYGLVHPEPIGTLKQIEWFAPSDYDFENAEFYAAQGNAMRIFRHDHFSSKLSDWKIVAVRRITAFSYIASGGYSGPQLYPICAYQGIKKLDRIMQPFPSIFATRLLVVLEKKDC